jgi:hypothetical protein
MKNLRFQSELKQCRDESGRRLTISALAKELQLGRSRLCETLNNKPGRGGQTRKKVIHYFATKHPDRLASVLAALQWDASGRVLKIVPDGTMLHVEQQSEAR